MMRNRLLINEPPIQVLPKLATIIGLNSAIFLQQLHYWANSPKTEGLERDGHKWIYNTYAQWKEENFPFWSERTIQRIVLDLVDRGILLVEQFHKSQYDRKNYYRIDYTMLDALITPPCQDHSGQDDALDDDKMARSLNESETTTETTTEKGASSKEKSDNLLAKASPEWAILAGQGVSPDFNAASAAKDAAQTAFERGLGFGQLPWGSSAAWDRLTAFITPLYAKNPDSFIEYVVWRRGDGKFAAMSNKQIRLNPQVFVDTGWPEYAATLKTTTTPFVPYKHDPRFEKWTPYPGKPKSPIKSEDE